MPTFLTRLLAVLTVLAAPAAAGAFPDGATVPTKDEIRQRVADKVFGVTLANRSTWRLEFKGNGYFFFNTSAGANGGGEWQAEEGRLCSKLRGSDMACSDVRIFEDMLYLKRTDGEVIKYVPR